MLFRSLLDEITSHVNRLIDSFRLGNAIKNGVPVAIAGATNTGKSTLFNALLGEDRAIVSDIHGTTRDTIEETLNIDGILFRFIDTAGLRETTEIVEKIGIERTFKKISEASVILGMVDLTRDFETSSETVREIVEKVDFSTQKLIILLNKTDICPVNKNVTLYNYIVSQLENKGIANTYAEFLKKGSISDHQDSESGNIGGISSKSGVKDLLETVESDGFKSSRNSQAYIIPISAKTGSGINCLRTVLTSTQRDLLGDSDTTLVTNQRHVQALTDARTSLLRVRDGLASGLPTDLAAQDIREAIYHLGSIVGEISTDEVLGNIFANFCIGK